jgi:uncharacterized membrane protein YsdA (DUF1294 family)
MTVTVVILLYFGIVNLLSFCLFGIDKKWAKKEKSRISEKTLFIMALIGGSIGAWGGMYYFRHKTKRWYFVVFIPLILLLQIVGVYFIVR